MQAIGYECWSLHQLYDTEQIPSALWTSILICKMGMTVGCALWGCSGTFCP